MKTLFSCIYFCVTFFSLFSLSICFIACDLSNSDHLRETKKPKTENNQSEIEFNMTRISFQDVNRSLGSDGKRRVFAIPLLPYPVDTNITLPSD